MSVSVSLGSTGKDDSNAFSGKTACITGGASGIGLGIAETLVAAGAKVALADVNLDALEQAAQALRHAGGTVLTLQLDVRDRERWRAAADLAEAVLGPVSILCNKIGARCFERRHS